jgi:hypothetical protein
MTFEFGVAGPEDDQSIRRLLADNPMPGVVTVAFEREPDYFLGHGVMGHRCVTAKAVDAATGNLAGIMCCAETERYVAGAVRRVGYIGQIRIDHRYRGYLMPMRAAAFVRNLAGGDWPDLWFSAIVADNPDAQEIFANRSRPSFPQLEPVTEIHTLGIFTRARAFRDAETGGHSDDRGIRVVDANDAGITRVVDFLQERGPDREFFPRYEAAHLEGDLRTPGLRKKDIIVAEVNGKIAAVCAVWDQSSFKQTVVHGYRGALRLLRPVVNVCGPVLGMKRLPGVGQAIKSAYLCCLAVRNDDPAVLRRLLTAAVSRAHEMGTDYLLAGFSTRDPLLTTARRFRHLLYRSTMYAFSFGPDPLPATAYDRGKIPYLEIAAL